jgi:four helix bundle protein
MAVSSYKDLKAWQKSMQLVQEIYRTTLSFPKNETFGLTSQMRRSAVSVPSNIAEGKGRSTDRDFVHFLCNARGSVLELETQVLIARGLGYITEQEAEALIDQTEQIGKMLNGLINALEKGAAAAPFVR